MKLVSLFAISCLLAFSQIDASPHDSKEPKITRNEAQHIALRQFPGARVTAAKLETVQGALVWSIEIAPLNAKSVMVAVDATTGRVVPRKEGAR